ncbi:tetratricopeptide repeat protein [Alteribacter natronophilus]|uniref:tetratricopeptide repeat protein n=1 Tax=Alteribacter natronophilus TaxID=2583810 RepID=UPI00110F68BA|nr:tetratricopeptide repeat protein [Alteribacter natronophilus]TMW71625.1 tetratricopeptide repeat protein [Alteribacter natronophilus]
MGKQKQGQGDNVIMFPGLVARLVEKGMSALKEKKHVDALRYFQQSTELEPAHPQARYGLVITNIELNRLDDAKKHCESMLKEGIGQYYEVLQVYVSLLVQLGDYGEVVTILETVIAEEKLPPDMAESFYQLLEFSRQMTSDADSQAPAEEEPADQFSTPEEWIETLERGDPNQQLGALKKLSQVNTSKVVEAYRSFLKEESNDPVLKSYVLQMMKDMNIQGSFEVHKFGDTYHIQISELEDVFHERFGNEVVRIVEERLGQESPGLVEMVMQVWWHYLFAVYPKSPVPLDARVWAAALHYLGTELLSESDGEMMKAEETASMYSAAPEEVKAAAAHIRRIETHLFHS